MGRDEGVGVGRRKVIPVPVIPLTPVWAAACSVDETSCGEVEMRACDRARRGGGGRSQTGREEDAPGIWAVCYDTAEEDG